MKIVLRPSPRLFFRLIVTAMVMTSVLLSGYIYFTFNSFLIGNISLAEAPNVLTRLDLSRFERVVEHAETRRSTPPFNRAPRNPFVSTRTVQPPADSTP